MSCPADFEELYDDHAQALFAFLLNFTRNEADTQDILQEVFVRIARRPEILDDIRDIRGFLLRLSHNLAVDSMRRRTVREKNADAAAAEKGNIFAHAADPDEAAYRAALAQAMSELPPDQRAIVHLKLWEERTFSEIAQILAISPNTAASRYHYGLDKLRERLRPVYDEIK